MLFVLYICICTSNSYSLDALKFNARTCGKDFSLATKALFTKGQKNCYKAIHKSLSGKGAISFGYNLLNEEIQANFMLLLEDLMGLSSVSDEKKKLAQQKVKEAILEQNSPGMQLLELKGKGLYNRFTCGSSLKKATQALLRPVDNPNCFKAIEKALDSPRKKLNQQYHALSIGEQVLFKGLLMNRMDKADLSSILQKNAGRFKKYIKTLLQKSPTQKDASSKDCRLDESQIISSVQYNKREYCFPFYAQELKNLEKFVKDGGEELLNAPKINNHFLSTAKMSKLPQYVLDPLKELVAYKNNDSPISPEYAQYRKETGDDNYAKKMVERYKNNKKFHTTKLAPMIEKLKKMEKELEQNTYKPNNHIQVLQEVNRLKKSLHVVLDKNWGFLDNPIEDWIPEKTHWINRIEKLLTSIKDSVMRKADHIDLSITGDVKK